MTRDNIERTGADTRNQGPIEIVELSPDDWTVLRDLKLRSLEQEPIAFEDVDSGREKLMKRTEAEWRDILAGKMSGGRRGESIQVFAKDPMNEKYVGMVAAIIREFQNPDNKFSTVQNMFVDAEGYRGQGVGKKLLTALIDKIKSRGDIKTIELQVVTTQTPAIELYKSLGFVERGKFEKEAKRGTEEFDEYQMELDLK